MGKNKKKEVEEFYDDEYFIEIEMDGKIHKAGFLDPNEEPTMTKDGHWVYRMKFKED